MEWSRSEEDLHDVLELRKICFPAIKDSLTNADLIAQHLLVRTADGLLCGAYRVTLSHQVNAFESEEDFILGDLLQKPGVKVELAWACVHPDYRDGRVIHLMWRGLSEFFKTHKVRYVFGLASITLDESDKLLDIVAYLRNQNYTISHKDIKARNGFLSDKALVLERPESSMKKRLLPSLLRAYIMAGALVCLQPVFDPDLDCYDFMTVLDVETVSAVVSNHFNF
ncbi:GNAT family N-acyltransferase [Bdellovibrio svalbardensis]|uniref:GNAT family N-acetyltransferase n=1 Tax=Bdellovibrio svalbardensis TaxID=2972972 RepID=A0ABT6DK44_9BACT|nr:GNAT family N-acyltransferase [Bdellovibrio svalbardensis]MDG0816909.1 GNAT family N-acetyltransferase [Bdellovibrio svalbardensis]